MLSLAIQQEINNCINTGLYLETISLCEQGLENFPQETVYYWYLGIAHLLQGDETNAQEIWLSVFWQGTPEETEQWTAELIHLLDEQINHKIEQDNFKVAKKVFDISREIDSQYQSQKWELYLQKIIAELVREAEGFAWSNNYQAAADVYQNILSLDNAQADIWHSLGIIYYHLTQYQNAYQAILTAIEIDAIRGDYFYSLGIVLEKVNQISEAIAAYQKAIQIAPCSVDAYNNLGNIFKKLEQFDSAQSVYQEAIEKNPNHFGSYMNLGNILVKNKQLDAAVEIYQKAIQLNAENPDIWYNLGHVYELKQDIQAVFCYGFSAYYEGNYEEAIAYFNDYLSKKIGSVNCYLTLAECHKNIYQIDQAITVCQEGIKYYPQENKLYLSLILLHQKNDEIPEARAIAEQARQLFPQDIAFKYLSRTSLPVVYKNEGEIDKYRQDFLQCLDELTVQTFVKTEIDRQRASYSIGFMAMTSFLLPYQARNDLELLKKQGNFVAQVMQEIYPEWSRPKPLSNTRSKIRIGYISRRLNSLGDLHLGWLKYCDRSKFEIFCYSLENVTNELSKKFEIYSDSFRELNDNLTEIIQQIDADCLDILIFLESGIDPTIIQLSGLRLAPIQCTTWGNPITSGMPTIDYFLSSEAMEPPNAAEHYSETLICLPKLGMSFPKPILPQTVKSRSEFGLPDEAILYFCCQSLSKYLPQYDYLFPAIAQQNPQAKFLFFESHTSSKITQKFRERLKRAFANYELDSDAFCRFLPTLRKEDFLNLNLLCDVFLDTVGYSGGFTTLDAIACQLPVVTYSGEFMRGRQSEGMLNILGVTETIAHQEAEYIDIAVRLGLDAAWRQAIAQKMADNQDNLFGDHTCIEALEKFFTKVVEDRS